MNTCGTCKYWDDQDQGYFSDARRSLRKCTYALELFDCCEWNEDGVDVLKVDRKAFVQDASDYHAKLLTKSEFGCNQWEDK